MVTIEYLELDPDNLDAVKPLWEKLNEHHRRKSRFRALYAGLTFERRKAGLLERSAAGTAKVDLVKDGETAECVAYCISEISADGRTAEIESIFVDPRYRGGRIGDTLMKRALAWMDSRGVTTKTMVVADGNEDVLAFYSRYGFFPKFILLEQVPA
jgi:ribosomal protein S18 acetylase RimI-like enzyme